MSEYSVTWLLLAGTGVYLMAASLAVRAIRGFA